MDADGFLWAYDTQKCCMRRMSPESICSEKYLYETKFENASEQAGKYVAPNEIENIFCRQERIYSKLISKIKNICIPEKNADALILHTQEKQELLSFIVNLCIRNPQSMQALNLSELSDDIYNSDEYKAVNKTLDEMGIGGTQSIFLAAQMKAMLTEEFPDSFPKQIAAKLSNLNYVFLYAQEEMFITSDVPVIVGDDPSTTGDDPTCLFLAFTPKVAVLFGNYPYSAYKRNRMVSIGSDDVHNLNRHFFMQTQDILRKWIIGSSKEQLEKYVGEVE